MEVTLGFLIVLAFRLLPVRNKKLIQQRHVLEAWNLSCSVFQYIISYFYHRTHTRVVCSRRWLSRTHSVTFYTTVLLTSIFCQRSSSIKVLWKKYDTQKLCRSSSMREIERKISFKCAWVEWKYEAGRLI